MRKVLEFAALVTSSPKTTISLTGESGVGKEVLARAVHFESGCLPGNFVAVNCAAIPEALLESELFGHVRGAFTGAERDREGKFGQARGGTLLLDEIGDMPLSLQTKLLRVLEERTYEKVGIRYAITRRFPGHRRHPSQSCRSGQIKALFREDLFHRINVVPIAIPPLCGNEKKTSRFWWTFILRISANTRARRFPESPEKSMDLLYSYSWPGNIRELRNVLEYAAIIVNHEFIWPEHLRFHSSHVPDDSPATTDYEYRLSFHPQNIHLALSSTRSWKLPFSAAAATSPRLPICSR